MPTLMRWCEAFRAPEVAKWQQKHRVDWDGADGRNGGAQRTVWATLMEMEGKMEKAKEEDLGAVALVLDLANALERVNFPVVWVWATHFSFTRKILQIEETDGSCCGIKKSTTSLSLFMETYGLEVEEELSTMATQYWAEGVWTRKMES